MYKLGKTSCKLTDFMELQSNKEGKVYRQKDLGSAGNREKDRPKVAI